MSIIKSAIDFIKRSPAPCFVVAIILSIRWGCRVSISARIYYPWNLTLGKNARIGRCFIIATGKGVSIGDFVSVDDGVMLDAHRGSISIHDHAAIGPFVVVYGEGGASIGKYSMVATHTTIVASSHVHTSTKIPIRLQGTTAQGISIEDDVWIGANAVIQDGVSLGKGVIVGSGAVVRSSFSEYSIVAGVPARVISTRK